MKIHRGNDYIHIDLSGAEAAVLLEELETVPGGSKRPKIRQVCEDLGRLLGLKALMAAPGPPKRKYLRAVDDPPHVDDVPRQEAVRDDGGENLPPRVRDAPDDRRVGEEEPLEQA